MNPPRRNLSPFCKYSFVVLFLTLTTLLIEAQTPPSFELKWGSSGGGNGEFAGPTGVAVDSSSNVYVTDSGNDRIQKFSSSGGFLLEWGASGSGDGQFSGPRGVAVDSSDNVYVVDLFNHRIQKFDSSGTFLTKWGTLGSGDGQFNMPFGVGVDGSGNVYVADLSNHRIQKFSGPILEANDDEISVSEEGTVSVLEDGKDSILANDTVAVNNTLNVTTTGIIGTTNGSVTINANGTFTYTHNGSETTTDSFIYEVTDGESTDTATVTVTIIPVNDNTPVTVDDAITVAEGGTVAILDGGASSVWDNDTDADLPGDTLSVNTIPVSGPTYGTLTLAADGTFSYTHDSSENFTDSFVYEVSDGGFADTATVTITITPENDNAPAITRKLYSVERRSPFIRQVNPATAATINSLELTLDGESIFGTYGLARNPLTEELWAFLGLSGNAGRELVSIDPTTGITTRHGDTGRFFSALAFDSYGILYAVTGDGGTPPETVFRINPNDGTSTFVMELGNGDNGEALAFNPVDGLFYHASGRSPELFENVDLNAKSVSNIPLSGFGYNEAIALSYESVGNMLLSDLSRRLLNLGLNGEATFIGLMDHLAKGLAFSWVDTTASQDNMTTKPFLGLTIEDVDSPALTLSVTITLDDPAKGVLSTLGDFSDDGGGMYSFSGTAGNATTAIQEIIFTPTVGRVAKRQTESTFLTLEVDDGTASPVTNTKTIISTAVDNSPAILSAPETTVNSSEPYRYDFFAFGPDPTDFVITTPTLPGWVSLQDNGDGTASLTGIPTSNDVGANNVSLVVTDTMKETSTTQDFVITVILVNHDPILRIDLDLYSVSRDDDQLRTIDITDGSTLSSVTIDVPGESIYSINGLATHPITGELWAVMELSSQSGRELLIIDPDDGSTTRIGDTGDNFAGIAFDGNGTLFGVTGDGASDDEELFILDQTDATPTFFMDLGNGSSGETIAFNPDDGLLYHGSGSVFEAIDLDQKTTTEISSSFSVHSALTYAGSGEFFLAVYDDFYRLSKDGIRTELGTFDDEMKGLAFNGPELSGMDVTDATTLKPFLRVSLSDSDILPQEMTVTVSLDDPAKGILATLGGFVDQGGGVYKFTGSAAAAASAIRGLTFVPSQNRVAAGLTETTLFTISADDGFAEVKTVNIKVVSTSEYDYPTISRAPALYSGDRSNNKLRVLDTAVGKTIKILTVDLPEDPVKKVDGLATHPITGELWASVTLDSNKDERRLVTIDPLTGTATLVGNTGDKITGLAFDNEGVLYGVIGTGNGPNPSESLFILNQSDATLTFMMTLGNGSSGETIGFNPDNGLIYHGSGEIFESIDLTAGTTTIISSSFSNVTALTYTGQDTFFMSQFSEFSRISIDGVQTILGELDHDAKGLAFNRFDGSGQQINDDETISPFTGISIGHTGDPIPQVTVTVTLDDGAKGMLTDLEEFSDDGNGVYSFSGTPEAATSALQGLVFNPTRNRVAFEMTETTTFTINVDDGIVTPVVDSTTTVKTTGTLEPYEDWIVRLFGDDADDPDKSGRAVDFSRDGLTNFLAYVFGLDPTLVNQKGQPEFTMDDSQGSLCIYFRVAKNVINTTYTIQSSTDLDIWVPVNDTPVIFEDNSDYVVMKVTVPIPTEVVFFLRLSVSTVDF